ncbi:unnamed protein product [Cyberlindnera jadinii]|uniref:Alpha/beta-hydrolase n=1 Tax=Cyberlindnera jadinii (strain ATCC 18201 / CBS 1600 / BCRC 20928 / JCM 3617 / NBRC 0987 / NRRL Y-1542) TaxID=983966 RepID=A0A0H5C8X8_CYBJN|nr:alpha/beta-hydrolase [Cyberlindnera jadinii NRRL Y-1542]ODV70644.1 alpha/beta-hydrolase [Cyberlindnera jadinii NRRL Y-1542]CEP24786.1 unnamed protein product [Cyberlindnera jadinii]
MAFNVRNTNKKYETAVLDHDVLRYKVINIQNLMIPMPDGSRLQANMWIPEDVYLKSLFTVGCVIEYLPYRTDVTILRDSTRHPWFAGGGLASLRIDMRGSCASDGVLKDEYLKQEQDDALAAFDWVVSQPWSNGNIAMFGKSWAGFNGLEIAARQHPALKTIISLMSSDDRYADDIHYRGGCLFASEMAWWGSTMGVLAPRPQDPRLVGEEWRTNWIQRLNSEPMVKTWLEHQTRDSYWKQGSINEDYTQVQIPVLAVGGWRDCYTSAVFRMVANLPNESTCGIIGPWVHEFPEIAEPGPKIGFQQLALKWLRKYLNPEEESSLDLPKLTAYIQHPTSIVDSYTFREGDWVSLNSEPNKSTNLPLFLTQEGTLSRDPCTLKKHVSGVLSHGLFRGTFCPLGFFGDFPADQRYEDSKTTTWDSSAFDDDLCLLGEPIMRLCLSSNKKFANVTVKVEDIYPHNGEIVLISWGQLNMTHRNSDELPEWLEPGRKYDVEVRLDVVGIKIAKGHKLRVAISTCDWPQNWPTPEIPTIEIEKGELVLPLLNRNNQVSSPVFENPTIMKGIPNELVKPYGRSKTVSYDYSSDKWSLVDTHDSGCVKIVDYGELTGTYHGSWNQNNLTIKSDDPLSGFIENKWRYEMGRKADNWDIKLETRTTLHSDRDNFYLTQSLKAFENDDKVFDKVWDYTIKRLFI